MNNKHRLHPKVSGPGQWFQENPNKALVLLVVLLLLPFISKPFNIDDPLFLWTAEQILNNPFDPYGFSLNWERVEEPAWHINKNPPLVSYFIALIALIGGFSEQAMHIGFILPALAVVTGTYQLARRLTTRPGVAAVLTAVSPAFLVSATTIMSDVLMLAFYIWALVLWDRGLAKGRGELLAAGAVLAGAAMLTKYFGASVLALMAVHAIANRHPWKLWAHWFLIPAVLLFGYQFWSWKVYGIDLFSDAGRYTFNIREYVGASLPVTTIVALGYTGACLAWANFAAPFVFARRWWWMAGGGIGIVATALLMQPTLAAHYTKVAPEATSYWVMLQVAFWIMGSVTVLAMLLRNLRDDSRGSGWLLFCWVVGTFLFSAYINWTINARTMLPLVPAAAILLARCLEKTHSPGKTSSLQSALVILPAAIIALIVASSDYMQAVAVRRSVETIVYHHSDEMDRLRFTGHWGFQYYMAQYGIGIIQTSRSEFRPGDLLAVPNINSLISRPPEEIAPTSYEVSIPKFKWAATMSHEVGAGFYASIYGPLPFVFGKVEPEKVAVHEFKYHASPQQENLP